MEIVFGILAVIGALVVLLWIALVAIVIAAWIVARQRPEELCCCFEIPGDNPDCPVHCDMPVEQRPTHFERKLSQRVKGWPVSAPCTGDSTERVHKYLRRQSKAN